MVDNFNNDKYYSNMRKIVLIGDIVASKSLENRNEVQRNLKSALKKVNNSNESLLSPLTVTLGDEFQGLYKNSDRLFSDIWQIISIMHPVRIRFSIGIGEIETPINKKQTIGMDGSAFHSAREGLEQIKKDTFLFNINFTERNIFLLQKNLSLLSHLTESWNGTRHKIFFQIINGQSVSSIAKNLQISKKAVYKNINSAGLNILKDLMIELSKHIYKLL